MRILIIEDDRQTREYLCKGLAEAGHTVDSAGDGREGLFLAIPDPPPDSEPGSQTASSPSSPPTRSEYDAAVIDRMLPGLDGLAIVRALRASGSRLPVLILSALDSVDHRVEGLRAGGDDYLVKPFAFTELLARLDALVRRQEPQAATTRLQVGNLELDLLTRDATRAGRRIALQPREFRLLEFLMRRAGQVVTRTMLLEGVWDYHFDPQTNVVDVHISRLRRKIDRDFAEPLLHTVRGAGYSLRAGASAPGGTGTSTDDEA